MALSTLQPAKTVEMKGRGEQEVRESWRLNKTAERRMRTAKGTEVRSAESRVRIHPVAGKVDRLFGEGPSYPLFVLA
jgi:hypothetical protein